MENGFQKKKSCTFCFYNHDRSQEKLNGLSSVEYRAKAV
ncbi:IS3 family transposase [Bacillus changyiensis]